ADIAFADRRVVGVSDDLDEALFGVERRRHAGGNRLESVEYRRRAGIEQDNVTDPNGDLVVGLFSPGLFGSNLRSEGGANPLQLRNLVGFGWRRLGRILSRKVAYD